MMMASVKTQRFVLAGVFRRCLRGAALLAVAALATSAAFATNTVCDGTTRDSFGYVCTMNTTAAATAQLITDITSDPSATSIADSGPRGWLPAGCAGGNDISGCYRAVTFANGATFSFYGATYGTVYVSSNGYLTFGASSQVSLPIGDATLAPGNTSPANAIFAYGSVLDSSNHRVSYRTGATCTGAAAGHSCTVILFNGAVHLEGDSSSTSSFAVALDHTNNQIYVEVYAENESADWTNFLPNIIGIQNGARSSMLWYYPDPYDTQDSGMATHGYQFIFAYTPVVAPANASKLAVAATNAVADVEFAPASAAAGTLILKRANGSVATTPTDGEIYAPGTTTGAGDYVLCSGAGPNCTDSDVDPDNTYNYKFFSFSAEHNYSSGASISSTPGQPGYFKWNVSTAASNLNPPSVLGNESQTLGIFAVGNDRLLHNLAPADGTRGLWDPPQIGGSSQARPLALNITPEADETDAVYVSGQDGFLYGYTVDGSDYEALTPADVANTVGGSAGCTGSVQAGPVAILAAYDTVPDNDADEAASGVIVGSRCSNANNKVVMYSRDLSTVLASYPDGDGTLGIINKAPLILYKTRHVVVPFITGGMSAVVLDLGTDNPMTETATISGIGAVYASPGLVRRDAATEWFVLGNDLGQLFVYDANGVALFQIGTTGNLPGAASPSEGYVKGIAASAPMADGPAISNWIVWSTQTKVHGVLLRSTGFDFSTYWERALGTDAAPGAPSIPVLLSGSAGGGPVYAFWVGSNDGRIYRFDATNATAPTPFVVRGGVTVGTPVFDYNDGTGQGMVVSGTDGSINWIKLGN